MAGFDLHPRPHRMLFDSSALTKRYSREAGRERVMALFEQAEELMVAAHCMTELAAALLFRRQDGSLPPSEFSRVWLAAQRDIADMTVVPLDRHVERFALAAMEHSPLLAMNALHVGSAMSAKVDLFVTCDPRQARAARGMGVPTECLGVAPKEAKV